MDYWWQTVHSNHGRLYIISGLHWCAGLIDRCLRKSRYGSGRKESRASYSDYGPDETCKSHLLLRRMCLEALSSSQMYIVKNRHTRLKYAYVPIISLLDSSLRTDPLCQKSKGKNPPLPVPNRRYHAAVKCILCRPCNNIGAIYR
jgi:hypothetical protein